MMSDLSQLTTATNNLKGKTDLSIVSWNINDSRDKFLGDKSDNAMQTSLIFLQSMISYASRKQKATSKSQTFGATTNFGKVVDRVDYV
jgi:hypothetical protein